MESFFALSILILILMVANVAGNCLVIIVLLKSKALRGVTSCMLLSLSFADVILGFSIVGNFKEMLLMNGQARWLRRMKFYGNATLCALTLVGIAIERYLAVLKPFYHKVHVTKKWACKIIFLIWLLTTTLSIPGFFLMPPKVKNSIDSQALNTTGNMTNYVSPNDPSKELRYAYEVFILCTFTVVPAVLMSILYGRIIYRIWLKPDTQGTNVAIVKARRKMTKLLLMVTVVFYLCWLPLLLFMSEQISDEVKSWVIVFPLLNTALNPIIYCLHSTSFREGIKSVFCACACCVSRKICIHNDADRGAVVERTATNF